MDCPRTPPTRTARAADEDDDHRREHRPALAGVADHLAEGVAERRRDHEDRQHLEEVRERRRVLERVRRVDVEEAAAVRAELLDGDLRRRRTHRDELLRHGRRLRLRLSAVVEHRVAVGVLHRGRRRRRLNERHGAVGIEVLDHALRDEDQREHQRQRQEDVERGAHEVDPEVAEVLDLTLAEAADERDERGHARGRGHEVLHREPDHLGQVAHRGFAAVPLPVRVGGEAHGRVERRVGAHGAHALRVERQHPLEALQQVDDQQADEVEEQHRDRVRPPRHPLLGIDAREPVADALDRPEDPIQDEGCSLVDPGHVASEWLRKRRQDDDVEGDLEEPVRGHQKRSGASSATNR